MSSFQEIMKQVFSKKRTRWHRALCVCSKLVRRRHQSFPLHHIWRREIQRTFAATRREVCGRTRIQESELQESRTQHRFETANSKLWATVLQWIHRQRSCNVHEKSRKEIYDGLQLLCALLFNHSVQWDWKVAMYQWNGHETSLDNLHMCEGIRLKWISHGHLSPGTIQTNGYGGLGSLPVRNCPGNAYNVTAIGWNLKGYLYDASNRHGR